MGVLYVQQMTDLDAVPVVKSNQLERGGRVRSDIATILPENATATAATVYAFFRVPARARIIGIYQSNADMTTGAGDWGVYRTTAKGGTVVDVDAFAVNVTTTKQTDANVATVGASVGAASAAAKKVMPLWQALNTVATGAGLTEALSDSEFDICFTLSTALGTEAQLTAEIRYVLPE
jgi:hypothetical protein